MLSWKDITWDIKKQAFGYLVFLTRKQSGKIKEREYANGRPQRDYITKEESIFPIVSLYAFMSSCLMDTMDNRKVITIDIPGTFLQDNWPQDKHPGYIMFKGIMVDMICEIDPTYFDKIILSKDSEKIFYTVN